MQTYFINTFTGNGCKGNPTVVCFSEVEMQYDQYLTLATDFIVPVTVFLEAKEKQDNFFSIRYFTKTGEIPACGHATLAAGKVLFNRLENTTICFITIEGIKIDARQEAEVIMMKYPAYSLNPVPVSSQLLESLQLTEIISAGFCTELETLFIELKTGAELRHLQPNYLQLMNSSNTIKEVVITAVSDTGEFDYLLRSFCPWIGIDEDPVTGSVHSVLAGYWAKRFNKTKLRAYQASVEGGEIIVETADNFVWIGGRTTAALL